MRGEVQLLPDGTAAPISVSADVLPQYFLAASNRSLVQSLVIENLEVDVGPDTQELIIQYGVESALGTPLFRPRRLSIPTPLPGLARQFASPRLEPDRRALAMLTERIAAEFVVSVTSGERIVGAQRTPVEVLAHNQWMFAPAWFDSLAAFCQPNSSTIDGVLSRAREILLQRTGSGATEGYQCLPADPFRVHQMAEAAFDALREMGLEYTDPPPSFEGYGQKVRTPEVVMAERAATCLDSAVLYASCLLRMGLKSQIVMIRGHALVSYWTADRVPRYPPEVLDAVIAPIISDPNVFDLLRADDVIRLVETTSFTVGHDFDFLSAIREGNDRCRPGSFRGLVDIEGCIGNGVVPLPSRRLVEAAGEGGEIEVETWQLRELGGEVVRERRSAAVDGPRMEHSQRPPRVEAWLRSLLDLSYANPLIRMRKSSRSSSVLGIDLPAGLIAVAEDRLMTPGVLLLRCASEAPSSVIQDPDDASVYGSVIARSGTVFFPQVGAYQANVRSEIRRLQDEPGAPPLGVLTNLVESSIAAQNQARLHSAVRGLKRKAADLEKQTGANNLFLCVGELTWTAEDGKAGSAPLFLIPVRITGSDKQGFAIAPDEAAEVMPNYALLEKLRQDYGVSIDSLERPLKDDAGIDVDELLAGVRQALISARIRDAVVAESLTVAVLDFSSFRLWRDIHEHWETFLESPVLHHLVHTPSSDYVDPGADTSLPDEVLCPIEADESQLAAIRSAVAGRTFVLEGPPGTGKSQTITNLIAASMAAGKKVLFVAEKSAALEVVRKRLIAVGLGPLCLELFDKEAKPEHIREQIRAALDLQPPDQSVEWDDVSARLGADERRLCDYREALHAPSAAGLTLWDSYQEVVRLGSGATVELPAGFLDRLPQYEQSIRDALLDLPRVAGAVVSVPHPHPWGLCNRGDFGALDLGRLAWAVKALDWSKAIFDGQSDAVRRLVDEIVEPEEFTHAAVSLDVASAGVALSPAEVDVVGTAQWVTAKDAAVAGAETFLATAARHLEVFHPNVLSGDLTGVLAAGQAAMTAGPFGRGNATRGFRAALVPYLRNVNDERSTELLMALLHQVAGLRATWAAAHYAAVGIQGLRLNPSWSLLTPGAVDELRAQTDALPAIAGAARSPIARAVAESPVTLEQRGLLVTALRAAGDAWREIVTSLAVDERSARRWTAGRSLGAAWEASRDHWAAEGERFIHLQRWCELVNTVQPLVAAGLGDFAAAILGGTVPLEDAELRFRRSVAQAAVQERMLAARLDVFDGRSHDRVVDDFATRFDRRRALMVDRIPAELVGRRPLPPGKRVGKWGELERLLSAKRGKLSIRRLIEEYGRFVGDLTPCFLMSPDSVARFIPPGSMTFDLVVFDEASQIEVPRGVGALGRAKAAVVVGDTKQMPPSRFGGASAPGDDESDGTELVVSDLESLLEECRDSRLPVQVLQCHYRSRHEALIAFSNHHFYEDELTTFPSPASGGAPVGWRRVDGRFRRRGSEVPEGETAESWPVGTNVIEAHAVVDEIVERVREAAPSLPSIGVVTSNLPQRELIRDLLAQLDDPVITTLLERDDDSSLLVQNLENVQGDERDVILMSIGFAPPVIVDSVTGVERRGRMPMNFGPLNQKGGERRLNVAVTRARAEIMVFCSFDPSEMAVGSDSPRGIQLLQAYLAAARDGAGSSGDVVGRAPAPLDRYRSEIAAAIRNCGYEVVEDIGLSRFRVDLGVSKPGAEGHRVAVLLDGPGWADRSRAYDRDVLPRTVLSKLMGWPVVVRIWLPMWLSARNDVLLSIEAALAEPATGAKTGTEPAVEVPERSHAAQVIDLPVVVPSANITPAGWADDTAPAAPPSIAVAAHPAVGPATTEDPVPAVSLVATAPVVERTPTVEPSLPVFGEGVGVGPNWPKGVLDAVATDRSAKVVVGEVLHELAVALAPIDCDELCRLTANRFGLARVRADRIEAIAKVIPRSWVQKSALGTYVWGPELNPETWTGIRANGGTLSRHFTEVPPEEVANAMVDVIGRGIEVGRDELVAHVLETFGVGRQTAQVKERLEVVLTWAEKSGRIVATESGLYRLP